MQQMLSDSINGINGLFVIGFLFNHIYSCSTKTYIEKDTDLNIFYWVQLTEVYYVCGGINAYIMTQMPPKHVIKILIRQYITYLIHSLTLCLFQMSLKTNQKLTLLSILGFQNFQPCSFSYFDILSIYNKYIFGQLIILIYNRLFQLYQQKYCAITLFLIYIFLRINNALRLIIGKSQYNQNSFLNQPIQELNAFFQAYFCGILLNGRTIDIEQYWLDFILLILLVVQQFMLILTENIRKNLMDNKDWQIFLIVLFNKHIQTLFSMIIIKLLLQSKLATRILNSEILVFLGQNVISSYSSFILTQELVEIFMYNLKIGPLDKFLINIIVLGQLIYVLFFSLLYYFLTKIIAKKLTEYINLYIKNIIKFFKNVVEVLKLRVLR